MALVTHPLHAEPLDRASSRKDGNRLRWVAPLFGVAVMLAVLVLLAVTIPSHGPQTGQGLVPVTLSHQ